MNPLAKDLFSRALELPDTEREDFLNDACGGDAELRLEVQRMLVDSRQADVFFGDTAGATIGAADHHAIYAEEVGDEIGPYTLRRELGEGGFGVVWLAEQSVPISRMVALKVVKAGMDTRQVLARFEAERQALAMMDHPNIARVLDAGATRTGRPYFAMEMVNGVPITRYCDEASLGTRERLELFRDVCAAINHAHQKGIIHRDIKPSNVMVAILGDRPVVKVIDFGIAKATQGKLAEHTLFTREGQFIGTPVYMSPEQAGSGGQDIDTRSDIYALGILLYELLTGSPPFDPRSLSSANEDEMRRIIREVEPERPSSRLITLGDEDRRQFARSRHIEPDRINHLVEPDLDWIVMKAIEKDRARRYETANAFSADIAHFLADEPVNARPPSARYQFQKFARRNRAALRVALVIAAVLVIATVVSGMLAVRAIRAERKSTAALEELRATAPAFVIQASSLAAEERFDEAIEKLDYALTLQPLEADYRIAKADLLQCQLKLGEAAEAYRGALRVRPGDTRARESAELCDELLAAPLSEQGTLSRESLAKLHHAMEAQHRPVAEIMPVARLLGEEQDHLVEYWLARLKDLPAMANRPLQERLTFRDDGLLELDLRDSNVTALDSFAAMPLGGLDLAGCVGLEDFAPLREFRSLTELDLKGTGVTVLSPLAGLPLESLDLSDTRVSDLSPLRELKLRSLKLRDTRVSELSPLAGQPLEVLDASSIPATDYSPLAGAPLVICDLRNSPLSDLSFLRDSPLEELTLAGCSQARGFAVLAGLKSLRHLALPQSYRGLPEQERAAIGALRDHPALEEIQSELRSGPFLLNETRSSEEFWVSWDRERDLTGALRAGGFKFELTPLPAGTYRLDISDQAFEDLSILKGVPISELSLRKTGVSDLEPLREMALTDLDISDTPVTDLSPLGAPGPSSVLRKLVLWRTPASDFSPLAACTKLEVLDAADTGLIDLDPLGKLKLRVLLIAGSRVREISALSGMPLERVSLCRTAVTDLSPLLKSPSLRELTIPGGARDLPSLRDLPALAYLSFAETDGGYPRQTAAEFWAEHERGGVTAEDVPPLAEASRLSPGNSLLSLKVAALQAWFEEDAEHAASCARVIGHAESAESADDRERAAKAWCFRPGGDPSMLPRVLLLARGFPEREWDEDQLPWYLQTLGMAEFRAGNDDAAESALLKAEAAAEKDNWHPELRPFIQIPSRFIRSMILHRRGKAEEAAELFREAEARMEPLPENAVVSLPSNVTQDQLLYWLFHREARVLIAP